MEVIRTLDMSLLSTTQRVGNRCSAVAGCRTMRLGEGGMTEATLAQWLLRSGCPVDAARRRAHVLWHLYCAAAPVGLKQIAEELRVSTTRVQLLRDTALWQLQCSLRRGRLKRTELAPGSRLYRVVLEPPLGTQARAKQSRQDSAA